MSRPPPDLSLVTYWEQALASEFGVELTPPREAFQSDLYTARQASGNPALDALRLLVMKDGTLWIVKPDADLKGFD